MMCNSYIATYMVPKWYMYSYNAGKSALPDIALRTMLRASAYILVLCNNRKYVITVINIIVIVIMICSVL